jgi:hypothetical protein
MPLGPHAAGCRPGRFRCPRWKVVGKLEEEYGDAAAFEVPGRAAGTLVLGAWTGGSGEDVGALGAVDGEVAPASPEKEPSTSAVSTRTTTGSCHPSRAEFRRDSTEYSCARGADKPRSGS